MILDETRHNRKDSAPSRSMLPSDGGSYMCPWIEDSVTILSDGTVTCGLDDSDGLRTFGNVHDRPISEIFANPEYEALRGKLRAGHRCRDCALHQPLRDRPVPRPLPRPALPRRLVVEPTIRCNLRCPQSACFANNSRDHRTRDSDDLPRDVLDRVLTQLGTGLEEVYFFNYGDPFMHRDAPAMIADIRRHSPDAEIVTSTNGIPLAGKRKAQELVAARLDHIVFTISGMTQESYARYHVNGRLESALLGLRRLVEARRAAGVAYPRIAWRYLVFRWTDAPQEIEAALALAEELGVDDFSLYLTHIPEDGWSYRMAEGSPGFARWRRWINVAHGYNRPPAPADGLYPVEQMPLFGRCRWTAWRARMQVTERNGHLRLRLATNAPQAVAAGQQAYLRVGRRLFKVQVPYCAWGEVALRVPGPPVEGRRHEVELLCPEAWFPRDTLEVEDYRCLGVLLGEEGNGSTLPLRPLRAMPASPAMHRMALRMRNGGAITPVESALFRQFDGARNGNGGPAAK